ncbi:carboxypeptidase-like regulatory domain-containing protein [Leptobacterium sp. I13]|uniref:carboxypeptidase-like regulatory domain-containing protein n=1 Tax=Leptobacterium meishanense TaxID=3128904 RepID=UPI0030EDEE39
MKSLVILLLLLISPLVAVSQETDRVILRGQVLYRNNNIPNENVINVTAEKATITNDRGEFEIMVKLGDELIFSAVNYQIKSVIITEAILKARRLVVEVNEKVTELDEVVVGPENREKFLELKEEEFKQYNYTQDRSTRVENAALPQSVTGLKNGLNVINIFKALFKSNQEKNIPEEKQIKMSEVLRYVYEDTFFTESLHIPPGRIDEFLYYCDTKMPAQKLLKKDNEFELIDFLVTQSNTYLSIIQPKEK